MTLYIHSHGTRLGGGYIVTLYIHSHGSRDWGWIYRDIIYSLPWKLRVGVDISWRYKFTSIQLESGVEISWHYMFTPMEMASWGGYIVVLYIHPHITSVGWIYRDIIYSLPWI